MTSPVPRIGLGSGRVEHERARFRTVPELLQYFCDIQLITHAELAERCGVRREQITRWRSGAREPTLTRLAELLEPLGWVPVLALERTEAAVQRLVEQPPEAHRLLGTDGAIVVGFAAKAAARGIAVAVGGEVAAVLQGIPVPTRHAVLHVRPDHRARLFRLATRDFLRCDRRIGTIGFGSVTADVTAGPARPATRLVAWADGGRVPVVDLAELLAGPSAVGSSVRIAASKLTDRAGRGPGR